MTGHTPGPWHVEPEEWTEGRGSAICSKGGIVAIIDPEVCMSAEDRANAHILAAAPELLEAAKDALESLRRLPNVDKAYRVTCMHELELAIKKAERK
jgi:hypothetical protein